MFRTVTNSVPFRVFPPAPSRVGVWPGPRPAPNTVGLLPSYSGILTSANAKPPPVHPHRRGLHYLVTTGAYFRYACGTYAASFFSAKMGLSWLKRMRPSTRGMLGQSLPIRGRA